MAGYRYGDTQYSPAGDDKGKLENAVKSAFVNAPQAMATSLLANEMANEDVNPSLEEQALSLQKEVGVSKDYPASSSLIAAVRNPASVPSGVVPDPNIDKDTTTGFQKWWQSDEGKMKRSAMFDLMTQVGAGMASIQPGSGNLAPVGQALANTPQILDNARERHHTGQFRKQLQKRIDAEMAKPAADRDMNLVSQWQQAMIDPTSVSGKGGFLGGTRAAQKESDAYYAAKGKMKAEHQRDWLEAKNWLGSMTEEQRGALRTSGGIKEMLMNEWAHEGNYPRWIRAALRAGAIGQDITLKQIRHEQAVAEREELARLKRERDGADGDSFLSDGWADFLGAFADMKGWDTSDDAAQALLDRTSVDDPN